MRNKTLIIALALVLGLGWTISCALGETLEPSNAAVTGILDVHGQAEITVEPDTVTVRLGANISRKDEKAAYAQANGIINQVLASMKALGVPDNKIKTSAMSVTRQYDYRVTPYKLTGYNANVALTVTLNDFTLINTVIDAAMENGANEVGDLAFSYSDVGEIYRQALQQAVEIARRKAEIMALAGGVELGMLLRMTEAGQNYYPKYYMNASMDMAASSESTSAQVMAGEISVTANVDLSYETLR